jgi:hypothetical protein
MPALNWIRCFVSRSGQSIVITKPYRLGHCHGAPFIYTLKPVEGASEFQLGFTNSGLYARDKHATTDGMHLNSLENFFYSN